MCLAEVFPVQLVQLILKLRFKLPPELARSRPVLIQSCEFAGIIKGDEIMVINGAIVSDLDMMYLESVLQEELALCMMMRSSRTEPPELVGIMRATDDIIESLVCPPPPSDPPIISEEMISGLIVPAPGWSESLEDRNGRLHKSNKRFKFIGKDMYASEPENSPAPSSDAGIKMSSRTNSFEIENLLKTAEQVTGFCRSPGETRKSSPTGSVVSNTSQTLLTPSRQLTDAEKLRKVILELVDTERAYVKVNWIFIYYNPRLGSGLGILSFDYVSVDVVFFS